MRIHPVVFVPLLAAMPAWSTSILWNQGAHDPSATAYMDQEFSDLSTFSSYIMNDVRVTGGGWTINTIRSYFSVSSFNWTDGVPIPVRLNIFSKTGALPAAGDDPAAGTQYNAAYSVSGLEATLEIQGLNLALADGDYWIGFSPIAAFGAYGQIFQFPTTAPWGDLSALRNPGGGFSLGTNWGAAAGMLTSPADFTLVIEGSAAGAPEPATWALAGISLLALAWQRRR